MLRWSFRLLVTIIFMFGLYVAVRMVHTMQPRAEIAPSVEVVLRKAGGTSIASGDVPVGSVLLSGGRIIGIGWNSVLRDHNAGGHAEINAVSNAIEQVGWVAFNKMDRDSLVLITTFEPCAMCRGMLMEYRIKNVIYNERKTLLHWMGDDLRWLRYELMKKQGGTAGLQDSLFHMHPAFDPEN